MLLFAAHDPGAKNIIRPIFEHALGLGYEAQFVDLATTRRLMDGNQAAGFLESGKPKATILGCSNNEGEWPLIRACKARGVPTAMMIDIGTLKKLDAMTPEDFPDQFMVTNRGCYKEVTELGAGPGTVVVTGDCRLEALSNSGSPDGGDLVRGHYGLNADSPVIPFFCSPTIDQSIDAFLSLAALLPAIDLDNPEVIVRPHPRSPQQERLESACRPFPFAHFDGGNAISNPALLSASLFTLSMGSTVTLESLVLGIPSAFFQVNWEFADLDALYRNLDEVVRIRTEEQLCEFVAAGVQNEGPVLTGNVESHRGAIERTWRVVEELMATKI